MDHKITFSIPEMLTELAEMMRINLSEKSLAIYLEVLRQYSSEQILSAIYRAAASMKTFPEPDELIWLIGLIEGEARINQRQPLSDRQVTNDLQRDAAQWWFESDLLEQSGGLPS